MEVFIFRGKGGFWGATKDPSAGNLPHLVGPWRFLKKTSLSRERGINPAVALSEIEAKGYFLLQHDAISGSSGST